MPTVNTVYINQFQNESRPFPDIVHYPVKKSGLPFLRPTKICPYERLFRIIFAMQDSRSTEPQLRSFSLVFRLWHSVHYWMYISGYYRDVPRHNTIDDGRHQERKSLRHFEYYLLLINWSWGFPLTACRLHICMHFRCTFQSSICPCAGSVEYFEK